MIRFVPDAALLQLERYAVPDVVADVLFVREDLMDRPATPGSAQIGRDAALVEQNGDLALDFSAIDELAVDPPNSLKLFFRAGEWGRVRPWSRSRRPDPFLLRLDRTRRARPRTGI